MRSTLILSATTLALIMAAPAVAQPAGQATTPDSSAAPAAPDPAAPAASADPAATGAVAPASVVVGQPVKDKTGLAIGQVSAVRTEASGAKVATIKMGADSFAVDTSALAVQDGAAVVNASQDEIKAMMKK